MRGMIPLINPLIHRYYYVNTDLRLYMHNTCQNTAINLPALDVALEQSSRCCVATPRDATPWPRLRMRTLRGYGVWYEEMR